MTGTEREREEAVEAVAESLTPALAQQMAALMSVGWTEDEARGIVDEALGQCTGNV